SQSLTFPIGEPCMKKPILLLLALALVIPGIVCAQVPTGAITGMVTDSTGARISGASVTVTRIETGLKRTVITSAVGNYTAAVLLPGVYEVAAEAPGFERIAREGSADAGRTRGRERTRNARYRGWWQHHGGRKWWIRNGLLAGSGGGISSLHGQL